MECYWIRTSEYDIPKLREASKGVAVLPLASIESHGPHLPTGSDPLCLQYLLDLVVKKETVAMLPVLPYSSVVSARMLPGAVHIRTDILAEFVEIICDEVYRNGFDKLVLLHGHGGNTPLHDAFLRRILEKQKPYVVYSIPVFGNKGAEINALLETEGGHACEMETSMNMVASPDLVNLKKLGKKTFPAKKGPDVGAAVTPVEFVSRHPEMAVGEPQRATKAKGEKIFSLWAGEIVSILRKVKKDRIAPSVMRRHARRSNSHRP